MSESNFNLKNKLLKTHLSLNKSMIIFFTMFYFLITVSLLFFTLVHHYNFEKVPYIAPTDVNGETNTNNSTSVVGDSMWTLYEVLSMVIFNGPGIILFFISNIYFINKIIIRELNHGQISIWMSFRVSRMDIIISKLLTLFIINFIIFISSFIPILIFASISQDAKYFIGYVIVYSLQFFIFIIFLVSILFIFSVMFNQKQLLLNTIFGVVLFWIALTWVLNLIYDLTGESLKILKYFRYISLQNLIFPVMKFSSEIDKIVEKYIFDQYVVEVTQAVLKSKPWALSISTLILWIILTAIINYFTIIKFKNKDIKI